MSWNSFNLMHYMSRSTQGGTVTYKPDRELSNFKAHHSQVKRWDKDSHLHQFKPIADPQGNRAERRAAKKLKRHK